MSKLIRLPMLVVVAMLLPACYHMRVMPEPIQPRIISVSLTPEEVLPRLRKVLDEELHVHVLKEEQEGNVLLTFPLQFHTDTGFGQPPGGRRYYVQLRIDLDRQGGQTMITVAADRFELRTSYAYSDEGQLHTLTKIYPYEEYPGMFDLSVMIREMRKVTGIIERAMKD